MPFALEVENLQVVLSTGQAVLQIPALSIPKGARVAIIGANGSGKSTLLRALAGLIPAGFDRYQLNHQSFESMILLQRARFLSYIGQQQQPAEGTTAWEWCLLSRYPYATSALENRQIIEQALLMSGALEFAERTLESLSGGERQRVYMAGALAQETPVIFLDEVNAALDPKYREALNQLLAQLTDKTILSITHDLNGLMQYTHILALKGGKLVAFGERSSTLNQALLSHLFDYAFTAIDHDGVTRYF